MSARPKQKSTRGSRKKIPNRIKVDVCQYRDMGLTHNAIAKKTRISEQSVANIINDWAPSNPERVKEARARALEAMSADYLGKMQEVMSHITPDSMTHDRIEVRDKDGNLVEVKHSGSSALQLGTLAAILADKSMKMQDKATELTEGSPNRAELTVEGIAELVARIQAKANRLGVEVTLPEMADADYTIINGDEDAGE